MKHKIIITFFLLTICSAFVLATNEGVRFIENKGQWPNQVNFKTDVPGGKIWLEKNKISYQFTKYPNLHANFGSKEKAIVKQHVVWAEFVGSNMNCEIIQKNQSKDYTNYFLGNDPSKWTSYAYAYDNITYTDFYENTDFMIYVKEGSLKYDFVLKPGSINNIKIKYTGQDELKINKNGELVVYTSIGQIIEEKPYAYQIIDGKQKEISCKFILEKNILSFQLGNYDKSINLILDPTLIFASYNGSPSDNFGMTATYDNQGNLYTGGTVFGANYPITPGVYNPIGNFTNTMPSAGNAPQYGVTDIFITKYEPNGTSLIYSTYIGGGGDFGGTEAVHSLICDSIGNLHLFGTTSSADFPISPNAYQDTINGGNFQGFNFNGVYFFDTTGVYGQGGTDIFVAKLNASGSSILGSTFIGGSKNDGLNYNLSGGTYNSSTAYDSLTNNYGDQFRGEIMLDDLGYIYITSSTYSDDFPSTNGFQDTLSGQQDAVVCKFSPNLDSLIWASYLGGTEKDAGYSIKLNANYDVFVAGGTCSTDFPFTVGTINPSYQGGVTDGFITKIDKNGGSRLASTFIGTSSYDQCYFVEIDRFGSIYTVGQTKGVFPLINANYVDSNSGTFIMKLDSNLSIINYSTVFGNGNVNAQFSPSAFLVDRCENVYVSGWGGSVIGGSALTGMPTTLNAYQSASANGFDFYLIVLKHDAQSLLYGTYFGGGTSYEHVDGGTSRFDKNGIIYQSVCAGCRLCSTCPANSDFPTYPDPGVWSNTNNSGNCNNGVFKFDFQIIPKAQITVDNYEGCAPLTVTFTNNSNSSDTYLWDFGGGDTTSVVFNPVRTFTTPGTYIVSLLIQDSICNTVDTAFQVIVVNPPVIINAINNDSSSCDPVTLTAAASGATSYVWSSNVQFTDTLNPSLTDTLTVFDTQTTTYYVMATNGICSDIDSVTINFHSASQPNIGLDNQQGCTPLTVNFTNNSGPHDYYLWNFGSGDTTSQTLNPIRTFSTPGSYPVTLTVVDSICNTSFTANTTITVAPVVTISVPNNSINTCDSVMLYSTATGATSYIWSTNNQFTDTLNPDLTDTITVFNTQITTYYVMATNGICSNIDSVTVIFHIPSIPSIGLDNQQGCTPLTVNFANNTDPHDYYLWNFGSGDTTSQTLNPIRTFSTPGSYPVTLTVVDSICNTTLSTSTTITVLSVVTIVTPNTITTCDTALLYSTTTGATSYIWSTNNQFTDTLNPSLNDSVLVTLSDTTTYYLMATNGVCPAIDSIKVNFIGVQIVATGGATCDGANDTLSVISLNNQTLTYNWQPISDIISGENTAFPIVNPSSTTTYNVTAQNVFGCSATASATVIVSGFNPNNIFITADDDTLLNGEVTYLHAQPDSNFTYLWLPSASLNNNTIANPLANPTTTTTYTVFFTETTSGCIYRKVYTLYAWEILCNEPDVYLPNAFTPNGDKENDVLFLRGRNVESMHLKIYDRWGELVFETKQQSVGWDGTYKGKPVDPAVFVYHLSVICIDDQEYFKKGNVTVIR